MCGATIQFAGVMDIGGTGPSSCPQKLVVDIGGYLEMIQITTGNFSNMMVD